MWLSELVFVILKISGPAGVGASVFKFSGPGSGLADLFGRGSGRGWFQNVGVGVGASIFSGLISGFTFKRIWTFG